MTIAPLPALKKVKRMNYVPNGADDDNIMPEKAVQDWNGINGSTWRRMIKRGETPPPIQLSPRRRGYYRRDVIEWRRARGVSSNVGARV